MRDLDDYDDEDLEPEEPAAYYRRQAVQLEHQLQHHPPTDPALLARRGRDLALWRQGAAAATIAAHWDSGEGDRKLF